VLLILSRLISVFFVPFCSVLLSFYLVLAYMFELNKWRRGAQLWNKTEIKHCRQCSHAKKNNILFQFCFMLCEPIEAFPVVAEYSFLFEVTQNLKKSAKNARVMEENKMTRLQVWTSVYIEPMGVLNGAVDASCQCDTDSPAKSIYVPSHKSPSRWYQSGRISFRSQ